MGSTACAYIGYGFELDRYTERSWSDHPEDFWAEKNGWREAPYAPEDSSPQAHASWRKSEGIKREILKGCPIAIRDCGEEWGPMWIEVIESSVRGDWECLKNIDGYYISDIFSNADIERWKSELKRYCEIMDIEYREPHWFLTATYF